MHLVDAMNPARERSISKFMSLVPRHEPEALGLCLDANGWADLNELASGLDAKFGVSRDVSRDDVLGIVARDTKGGYVVDGDRIRATQGPSVDIDLDLPPVTPPETLFHGTMRAALPAILADGLERRQRSHVHLSADVATARAVGGRRRGETVVLVVAAGRMHRDGHSFYQAQNGVWLVDAVAASYLQVETT